MQISIYLSRSMVPSLFQPMAHFQISQLAGGAQVANTDLDNA